MDFARRVIAGALRRISPRLLAAVALWRIDRNEIATSWWLGKRPPRAVIRKENDHG